VCGAIITKNSLEVRVLFCVTVGVFFLEMDSHDFSEGLLLSPPTTRDIRSSPQQRHEESNFLAGFNDAAVLNTPNLPRTTPFRNPPLYPSLARASPDGFSGLSPIEQLPRTPGSVDGNHEFRNDFFQDFSMSPFQIPNDTPGRYQQPTPVSSHRPAPRLQVTTADDLAGLHQQSHAPLSQIGKNFKRKLDYSNLITPTTAPPTRGSLVEDVMRRASLGTPQQMSQETPASRLNKRASVEKIPTTSAHLSCNCDRKKMRCLALYCVCFAANGLCSDLCNCNGCHNNSAHEDEVEKARDSAMQKKPGCFDPKVEYIYHPEEGVRIARPAATFDGCKCTKSQCKNGYCQCVKNGLGCGRRCKCTTCNNPLTTEDSKSIRAVQIKRPDQFTVSEDVLGVATEIISVPSVEVELAEESQQHQFLRRSENPQFIGQAVRKTLRFDNEI